MEWQNAVELCLSFAALEALVLEESNNMYVLISKLSDGSFMHLTMNMKYWNSGQYISRRK